MGFMEMFYHDMIMFMLIIKDQESVIAIINSLSDFYEELENHKCVNDVHSILIIQTM